MRSRYDPEPTEPGLYWYSPNHEVIGNEEIGNWYLCLVGRGEKDRLHFAVLHDDRLGYCSWVVMSGTNGGLWRKVELPLPEEPARSA